jgi:hypothetical protein
MPLTAIDYSHTFIYKICCKDPTITDVYVGHTTNVVKRKQRHKGGCNIETYKDYNTFLYQFIRNNGGWDNFEMIVLIELNCKDKNEAERNERKYLEELKATLNKTIPTRTPKEYYEDNKEKTLNQKKEYYQLNKEERQLYNKTYREQNIEHRRTKENEYNEKHREHRRLYAKEYREKQKALKALSI